MTDKRRILFVDDEPRILHGLRRMLRPMRHEWDCSFAENGREALDVLDREPFDVVVADMRMPGMDGAELLMEVATHHPETVRVVLSGQSDEETVLRAVRHVHQYLSKPCDMEMLRSTIARACALSDLLEDDALKQLVSQLRTLPSLPTLYREVEEELRSPDASAKNVAAIVSKDLGMSAKILQLVNSAFFGVRQHVSSPNQAVILLGLETIKNLVLSVQVFAQLDEASSESLPLEALWTHSMRVGACAKQLARAEQVDPRSVDHAFIAGLLHDVGKLVLAVNLPERYDAVLTRTRTEEISLHEAEREVFGTTHAEIGSYLMGLWGLYDAIVESLASHHAPMKYGGENFTPVTAVYAANVLVHEACSTEDTQAVSTMDDGYLTRLGMTERLPAWRAICREAIEGGEDR